MELSDFRAFGVGKKGLKKKQWTSPSKFKHLKFYSTSGPKYLEKNSEIQENWTGKEKFGIYFCVFLTAIA